MNQSKGPLMDVYVNQHSGSSIPPADIMPWHFHLGNDTSRHSSSSSCCPSAVCLLIFVAW